MSAREANARSGIGVPVLIAAVALALGAGVAIGYLARGEPEAGAPVTIEEQLPAVTVTVPAEP